MVGVAVLPALAEVFRDRPTHLQTTYYKIRQPLDVICLPAAGVLFVLGPLIVSLLYDTRYAEAGWILSVLGLTLVATPLGAFDQCLIAIGRIKYLSALNIVRLVTLYVAVTCGFLLQGGHGAIAGIACKRYRESFYRTSFSS